MLTTSTVPLAPGVWTLDPLHCTVEFTVRHTAISKVRGRFRKDYDLDFNVPLGAGGFVIGDQIGIELDLQLRGPTA